MTTSLVVKASPAKAMRETCDCQLLSGTLGTAFSVNTVQQWHPGKVQVAIRASRSPSLVLATKYSMVYSLVGWVLVSCTSSLEYLYPCTCTCTAAASTVLAHPSFALLLPAPRWGNSVMPKKGKASP